MDTENNQDGEFYKEFSCHNDCITLFNEELYKNIFNKNQISSKKKCIPNPFTKENLHLLLDLSKTPTDVVDKVVKILNIGQDKIYGYFLEKDRETFFVPDKLIREMPMKVVDTHEVDYKGDVFKIIINSKTIVLPAVKKVSFRELVDIIGHYQHTNPLHFILYKILTIVAFVDRINIRVSTDSGFGKDSIVETIKHLLGETVNIYGATFAKLEYLLNNKLMILNEMGNLDADEKRIMQEFLLAVGAYFNSYTKRTRRTLSTQEIYDISKLSLMILYNLPSYYEGKAQQYFDQIFTRAVTNRFIPFVFDGHLTSKFNRVINPRDIMEKNTETYKNIISTLTYYRQNNLTEIKYNVPDVVKFGTHEERYYRTFNTTMKYIAEYAESQEEFNSLVTELFNCYRKYGKLLSKEKTLV